MINYFDRVIRGTEREDNLKIVEFLRGMVGQTFLFLNYYKEIPVSYDARLLSLENEMAEFDIHEYQAKVISIERQALIYVHEKSPVKEDIVAEAFYVNAVKKRVILCKFGYARISAVQRRFVRVSIDIPVAVSILFEENNIPGNILDISLGGTAVKVESGELLYPGLAVNIYIHLPDSHSGSTNKINLAATVIKVVNEPDYATCYIEFILDKIAHQQISYFINQRQVEIIKALKDEFI
jgi:c-di-GMP-binding flagellar brake protein YcgR